MGGRWEADGFHTVHGHPVGCLAPEKKITKAVCVCVRAWERVRVCLSTRTFGARAWRWRRDRSAAVDVMVTGCQVLYSLALIVILYLLEGDYFKSDSPFKPFWDFYSFSYRAEEERLLWSLAVFLGKCHKRLLTATEQKQGNSLAFFMVWIKAGRLLDHIIRSHWF